MKKTYILWKMTTGLQSIEIECTSTYFRVKFYFSTSLSILGIP